MLSALLGNAPHHIRYEASEDDWDQRILHMQRLVNAVDAYIHELGRDCAQHAHTNINVDCFVDGVSEGVDDALGQMEQGAVAAREHEKLAAE
jgi:hypothetical protein